MPEISKAYGPEGIERKWYEFWLKRGYFTPKTDPKKKPFVIIMPPPNVTGELHVGHALTSTLEDIMVRWHRMKGEPTLWLPGVDHAGIATQFVVEQKLAAEGLTRHDLGREKFLERAQEWVGRYRKTISYQHQRLGVSCDWSRERFTMDAGPSRAVATAFVRLYRKGLVYRGERIINWCPRCQTALSDLEVQHKEIKGNLFYIRYRLLDSDTYVTVATTRPETYFGDAAVAVNPEDKRYLSLPGRNVLLPFIDRAIPVIADSAVDSSFGTGALKITPGHDPVDFEIGRRHDLPMLDIFNADATLNQNAGPYQGLDRFTCRDRLVADLKKAGLLEKTESHVHAVGHCHRCQTMLEPRVSQQWFVRVAPLAEPAIRAVQDGSIRILPEHFVKTYLNWMENIRDWCISRQLWWGHRIPVWYCSDCGKQTVAVDQASACAQCGSCTIKQDPDVLDTWFSSSLWPHSTLGWPEETEDLGYFYPTSVMETGYDILFFWVARMIMMGIEDTGQVPFHTVYLHGLVRDEKGEKMSKLKGNVVSPLDVIDTHGTDALRFALTTGSSPGNDVNLSSQRLEAGRNFANKLWNASRYILRSLEGKDSDSLAIPDTLPDLEDRWILSRLSRLTSNVDKLLSDFEFGEAEKQIHDFFWGDYCDWYIEISKTRLVLSGTSVSPLPVLLQVLETVLRLLHPFTPFITEEIWQNLKPYLPGKHQAVESIVVAPYPVPRETDDPAAERAMGAVIDIVRAIRNARAEYRVEAAKWIKAEVYADSLLEAITSRSQVIETLARVRPLAVTGRATRQADEGQALVIVLQEAEVVLPWEGMVDIEAEKKRLERDMDITEREIARLGGRLADRAFTSKAPEAVVEKERAKLQAYKDKVARLKLELGRFG